MTMYPRIHGILSKDFNNGCLPRSDIKGLYNFEDSNDLGWPTISDNYLTNVNGVTQTTGKLGNGIEVVEANSSYMTINEAPTEFSNGQGDFTVSIWFYPYTVDDSNGLVGVYGTGGTFSEWLLYHPSSSKDALFAIVTDVAFYSVATGDASTPNQWYLFVGGIEGTDIFVSLNGGAKVTAPYTGTPIVGTPGVNKSPFSIGQSAGIYSDGVIDQVALYNKALSNTEIACVYNAGAGTRL